MTAKHADLATINLHVPGYFQSGDPGAVGAGKYWVDTTVGPPYQLKVRDAGDTGWEEVGIVGGSIDHGTLTGLGDDDHPQYATDADLTTHAGAADPHTGYQKESEKGAVSGYASLDGGGTVPDAQIPAAIARDSEVSSAVSTHEGLSDPHTGYVLESLLDTKGDLIAASADNTPAKLPAGSNGQLLAARSAESAGLKWESQDVTLQVLIDGAGAVITTGQKAEVLVDFACTIISATVVADQSGSVVVDILKSTYAGFPGSLASIVASAPPTLSSAQKSQDTTLTGWTTAIAAGDVLRLSVTSAATITRATVALKLRRV